MFLDQLDHIFCNCNCIELHIFAQSYKVIALLLAIVKQFFQDMLHMINKIMGLFLDF